MATAKSHNGLNRGVSDPANYTDAADSDDIRRDIDRVEAGEARDVNQMRRALYIELHKIEQRRTPARNFVSGLAASEIAALVFSARR